MLKLYSTVFMLYLTNDKLIRINCLFFWTKMYTSEDSNSKEYWLTHINFAWKIAVKMVYVWDGAG